MHAAITRLPIRSIVGLAAGAASMAFVILAGVTAPRTETALQVSAKCPDAARESALPDTTSEAKSPA